MSDFLSRLQDAVGSAWQIERELPLGGLGRMFLGTEVATGRQVSVQALPPDLASRLDTNRFRAAVDRVSRLKHQGILPLLAAGARGDVVFCVWPHPGGESLRQRLVRDGGLGADESLQVLYDVADALSYAHEHGVNHGDLRPDSVFLEGGRATVAEFGIRAALNAALGTEGVMDARADLHALAVAGQHMLAGRTGPVAEAVARALSIDPAEQYGSAAAFRSALGTPPAARRRRARTRMTAAALLALAAALAVWRQVGGRPGLDANLLAVVPFEVLDPENRMWGEGLVTVLAASLDGAGPLRTVSPTVAVRGWSGRADVASALSLGHRTGAGLALIGRVVRTGGDTLRLSASLVDVAQNAAIADLQLSDSEARLDRLADSLTLRVLRELGRSRPIGAVSRTALRARSLPALKAFLQGEQHFRRSEWDSAVANYQRAIEMDSTFALAFYRAGVALGWLSTAGDSLSTEYLRRAASHNRGLPARDSMLIVAESLSAALEDESNSRYWEHYRRIYLTTAEAARLYPRDPEVWYEYGEVRYHYPVFSSRSEMRAGFDRSISLDSAFAPAYIHPIELSLQLGDLQAARRYVDRYLALRPRDVYADAMRLTRRLLDPRQARSEQVAEILDTASADLLVATIQSFRGWADTLQTAVRLASLLVELRSSTVSAQGEASVFLPELGSALAYHGRLREAWQRGGTGIGWLVAAVAWMGGAPRGEMEAILARSLESDRLYPRALAAIAAPWWAEIRDSSSLAELASLADSTARAALEPPERSFARSVAGGARALRALARGDTGAAIRGLQAVSDTACARCILYRMQLVRLLDARRADAEAARILAADAPGYAHPTDGFWMLYRARLASRQGDDAAAKASYRFVRDVWRDADEPLQMFVREAQEYLARASERD